MTDPVLTLADGAATALGGPATLVSRAATLVGVPLTDVIALPNVDGEISPSMAARAPSST